MIQFTGEEDFPLPIPEVYAVLADAGAVAHLLPDAQVGHCTPDQATWSVRPKLSFLAGALESQATVTERRDGDSIEYTIESKGVGSGSTVVARLTFLPIEPGTRVQWQGEITRLTGLLKLAPKGLIQATAQKVIGDLWQEIHQRLHP